MPGKKSGYIRLGGPLFEDYDGPDQWISLLRSWNYSAAYCPVDADVPDSIISSYAAAAEKENIIIAEVGAWSNPISPDDEIRKEAIDHCCIQLDLADKINARCCVNIAGSLDPEKWDAPHPENFSKQTFDLIVETTRQIIDSVKPKRSYFTLETMPWIYPDTVDSYVSLLKAIDQKQFAVHFDPVNMINSPRKYYDTSSIIKECFARLGPHIRSCHGKDTKLDPELTTHIREIQPGKGNLDYRTYLKELSHYPDTPLMLEHIEKPDEYRGAITYIRSVAKRVGVSIL